MQKQNKIPIDQNAVARTRKILRISFWSRLLLGAIGVILLFVLTIPWWPWRVVILVAAIISFCLSILNSAAMDKLKAVVGAVEDGETYIPNIATRLPHYAESIFRDEITKMVKIGIFPGVVIHKDTLMLEGNRAQSIFSKTTSAQKGPFEAAESMPRTQVGSFASVQTYDELFSETVPAERINLNTANEQELASLPGIGAALAKKVVGARTQNGDFSSVSDFNQRLGLMPHHAAQIENLAFVEFVPPQAPPAKNKGRVLDI